MIRRPSHDVYTCIYMWFLDIVTTFTKHKIQFAVAGGYAVSLHGAVRGRIDLDFVIALTEANLQRIEDSLTELGYQLRIPVSAREVYQFRKEYIQKRNLIAWSFYEQKNPAHI